MNYEGIVAMIHGGVLDDNLETLEREIKERRRVTQYRLIHSLKSGDRIKIAPTVRPRYLAGLPGKVVRVMQTYVEFELDQPCYGQGRTWHRGIRLPHELG